MYVHKADFLYKFVVPELAKKFPTFMVPECSSRCSQQPVPIATLNRPTAVKTFTSCVFIYLFI
jgi:hypothetical protein